MSEYNGPVNGPFHSEMASKHDSLEPFKDTQYYIMEMKNGGMDHVRQAPYFFYGHPLSSFHHPLATPTPATPLLALTSAHSSFQSEGPLKGHCQAALDFPSTLILSHFISCFNTNRNHAHDFSPLPVKPSRPSSSSALWTKARGPNNLKSHTFLSRVQFNKTQSLHRKLILTKRVWHMRTTCAQAKTSRPSAAFQLAERQRRRHAFDSPVTFRAVICPPKKKQRERA